MDGSDRYPGEARANGNSSSPPPQQQPQHQKSDLIYADKMRDRLNEINKRIANLRERSQPYIANLEPRINTALGDFHSSSVWTLLGTGNKQLQKQGVVLGSMLSAINERELEQPQADALVERLKGNARASNAIGFGSLALAGVLAARRRKAVPAWVLRSSLTRIVWPSMLFLGYLVPISLFVTPFLRIYTTRYYSEKFLSDDRLKGWNLNVKSATKGFSHEQHEQLAHMWQASSEQQPPMGAQAASGWDNAGAYNSTSAPPQPRSQQQSSWDNQSSVFDDDASPVSPSAAQQAPGSSWARVRGQAAQQQAARSQARPQASQDGWGEPEDTSAQFRGASTGTRDRDAYSSQAFTGASEKDRAQREFDRLLEQERRGKDQSGAWSGR